MDSSPSQTHLPMVTVQPQNVSHPGTESLSPTAVSGSMTEETLSTPKALNIPLLATSPHPCGTGTFVPSDTSPVRPPISPIPPSTTHVRTLSGSSLTSLSSAPSAPRQDGPPSSPPPSQEDHQGASRPIVRQRTASLSSMSSLSSLATSALSTAPAPQTRLLRSQKLSASTGSASMANVKAEKGDTLTRPAKRRKTMGTTQELRFEPSEPISRKGGSAKIARPATRNRKGRKNQTLHITPVIEPKELPSSSPLTSPLRRKRYQVPRIGTDCPWPDMIAGDEMYRRQVRHLFPAYPSRRLTSYLFVQMVACDKYVVHAFMHAARMFTPV